MRGIASGTECAVRTTREHDKTSDDGRVVPAVVGGPWRSGAARIGDSAGGVDVTGPGGASPRAGLVQGDVEGGIGAVQVGADHVWPIRAGVVQRVAVRPISAVGLAGALWAGRAMLTQ